MPENLKHPEREELWRLATGALPERESERLAVHLKHCQRCAELFDSFSLGMDPLVARIRGMRQMTQRRPQPLVLGRFLNRFRKKAISNQPPTLRQEVRQSKTAIRRMM